MTAPTPPLTDEQVAEWKADAERTYADGAVPPLHNRILALIADRARLTEREAALWQAVREYRRRIEVLRDEWLAEPAGSALLHQQAGIRLMHILAVPVEGTTELDRNLAEHATPSDPPQGERCGCGHSRADHVGAAGACLERDRNLPCGCDRFAARRATSGNPTPAPASADIRLTDAESAWVTRLWDRDNNRRGRLAEAKRDFERFLSDRLAAVERERDEAESDASHMQESVDDYLAEVERLRAVVAAVEALIGPGEVFPDWSKYPHLRRVTEKRDGYTVTTTMVEERALRAALATAEQAGTGAQGEAGCHCGAPTAATTDPPMYETLGPAAAALCERCLPLRCDAHPGACAEHEQGEEGGR